jgi:hypothetical protein
MNECHDRELKMKINAEFDKRVIIHSNQLGWVDSPMPGVTRRPLDRVGDEVARATSIVKYASGSHFSSHVHTGGEEFFVLDGVFQDEHGDFPEGSYIRNPPQSSHTPGSELGCIIFVKLWQFQPSDPTHVRINTHFMQCMPKIDQVGVCVIPLYKDEFEEVSIEYWDANIELEFELDGGAEILVLAGSFSEGADTLEEHSWLRLPTGSVFRAKTGNRRVKVWVKRGHLFEVDKEIARLPA